MSSHLRVHPSPAHLQSSRNLEKSTCRQVCQRAFGSLDSLHCSFPPVEQKRTQVAGTSIRSCNRFTCSLTFSSSKKLQKKLKLGCYSTHRRAGREVQESRARALSACIILRFSWTKLNSGSENGFFFQYSH